MTRKKSAIEKAAAAGAAAAVAAATGDQVLDLDGDEEVSGEQEEVFRALRELGTSDDEIVWQVVKMSGPPNQRGFIEKLSTSQLDLQFFRDSYGPGDYRVMGYRGSQYVKGGHRTVKISDVGYKPQAHAAAVPSGGSAADIIAALDKRNEARASELKSWAQILTPLVVPLLGAWIKPRENQVTELVQGLAALKGLTPDLPKPEPLESQLDRIIGVMDKLKEAKGEPPSTGATWVDIVRDGIQGAKPLLEGLAGRLIAPGMPMLPPPPMLPHPLPQGPTSVTMPPAASSAAPPSTAPTPPGGNGNGPPPGNAQAQPVMAFLPWLRQNLEALIYQAGRNKDPGLYASVMLDNLPPGTDPALLKGFIERADWWEQLRQFAPGVTPYPAWFEEFREAVLEIMNAPPGEEPPGDAPAQPAPDHNGEQEPFT